VTATAILSALTPLAVVLIIVLTDVWVYLDAHEHLARGEPVVVSIGPFNLESPAVWAVVCLVLWIVAFPLYIVARGSSR